MIPGPDLIYKCPNCGKIVSRGSLISGNTFGSKLYSDGKQIAPMLPDFPAIVKCKQCNIFYWLNDENKIGEYSYKRDTEKWENVGKAEFLSLKEYIEAINLKAYKNNDEEYFFRLRLWWKFNDRIRNGEDIFIETDDKKIYEANCKRIIEILDKNKIDGIIICAELYRNLENYTESIKILETILEVEYEWIIELLKKECKHQNNKVIELKKTIR